MFKNVMSFIGVTALLFEASKLVMAYSGQASLTGFLASALVFVIGYALYGYILLCSNDGQN